MAEIQETCGALSFSHECAIRPEKDGDEPMVNPTMLPTWLKRPCQALAVASCSPGVMSRTRLRREAWRLYRDIRPAA